MRDVRNIRQFFQQSERGGELASQQQVGYLASLLNEALQKPGTDANKARRTVIRWMTGKTTSKDLTKREASWLIDWMTGPLGPGEARAMFHEALRDAGMGDLFEWAGLEVEG